MLGQDLNAELFFFGRPAGLTGTNILLSCFGAGGLGRESVGVIFFFSFFLSLPLAISVEFYLVV